MNILFVSTMASQPWGGSEELWYKTVLSLSKEDNHQIHVNLKKWDIRALQVEMLFKKEVFVEERVFFTNKSLVHRILDKFSAKSKRKDGHYNIEEYLLKIRPDRVVVCQGSNEDGLDWMLNCIKLSIPYCTISQAASETLWPEDQKSIELLKGFSSSKMNYFVSVGNSLLTQKQLGSSSFKSKVIRNPFNVPYNLEFEWPELNTNYKFACVGRIHPASKGHDLIFEVLNQEKWHNRNYEISFYGHGPNVMSLQRLVTAWNIKNVTWAGFENNVEKIWKQNHCLLLPSRYEGLPLSAVEACLCGRVCILTDVAGNNEIIQNNITGFLADAPNFKLLDEAMDRAWQARYKWEEIGQAAQKYIRTVIPENPVEEFLIELKKDLELT